MLPEANESDKELLIALKALKQVCLYDVKVRGRDAGVEDYEPADDWPL